MNNILTLNSSIIRPLIFKWKFNLRIAWFLGVFLVVFLVGFYVFQVSEVTKLSFAVADYEKKVAESDKKFKNLQVIFSDADSLSDLEGALIAKGYEKVNKINYIQVLESTVVTK